MNQAAYNAVPVFECFTCGEELSREDRLKQKSHCPACEPHQGHCEQVSMSTAAGLQRVFVVPVVEVGRV